MIKCILNDRVYIIVNCIDIFTIGKFLNAYLNAISEVFPQVAVFTGAGVTSSARNAFVIIAGNKEIEPYFLYDRYSRNSFQRLPASALHELSVRNGGRMLTDDYAPVENLIAPVFLHRVD
jgi:hypothetical protein